MRKAKTDTARNLQLLKGMMLGATSIAEYVPSYIDYLHVLTIDANKLSTQGRLRS